MRRILNRFSNYKVRAKLILLNGIFLISLIILGFVVNLLFKSSQTITILTNEHKLCIDNIGAGTELLYKFELKGNKDDLNQSITRLKKAYQIAWTFSNVDSILNVMSKKEWLPYFYNVYKEGVDLDISKIELMGEQIKLFDRFNPKKLDETKQIAKEASFHLSQIIQSIDTNAENISETLPSVNQNFEEIKKLRILFSKNLYSFSDYLFKLLFVLISILVIIMGTIVTVISTRISRSISDPINKLADNFKKIASGNLRSSVNIDSRNEVGDLSKAFLKIQVGLQDILKKLQKVITAPNWSQNRKKMN
jgi:methyl-accepting chemotaxis protein